MSRWLGALATLVLGAAPVAAQTPVVGTAGREVFTTQWAVAGTPGTAGRNGLGPLFNAASCDSCHRNGGHGDGPVADGPAPVALVIKLASSSGEACADPPGDPVYGRVFNTAAQDGVQKEGLVTVRYREITGTYYPGGTQWSVRDPRYALVQLSHGQLAPTTVIEPRVAPSLYGLGLLEAVPDSAITGEPAGPGLRASGEPAFHGCRGTLVIGRFGWQGNAISVRDQTANAFAREMGLTSSTSRSDDCTAAEVDCRRLDPGAIAEVPDDSFEAVVAFARAVAVPAPSVRADSGDPGPRLFAALGCDACHRPALPVELPGADGKRPAQTIAAYTDLRLHDLGGGMADRTVAGKAVPSKWRTAPLWGIGFRLATEHSPTFLHDGRARTTEEAILWHLGEGARSQRRFKELLPGQREALLRWLATL